MEAPSVSFTIWQAFNNFNPDLDITPIEFRRMTVTALFSSMYFSVSVCVCVGVFLFFVKLTIFYTEQITKPDSENFEQFLQQHANLLNVSPQVMSNYYNRYIVCFFFYYFDKSYIYQLTFIFLYRFSVEEEYASSLATINDDLYLGADEQESDNEADALMVS